MKILYVVPEGEDMGGIITASEQFMQGFKELGHQATFCLLRATKKSGTNMFTPGSEIEAANEDGWRLGEGTGMAFHTVYGWHGPYISMESGIDEFIGLANAHDVVIWAAMFGLRNKLTEGTTNWTRMFTETKPKHICQVRDDHIQDRYPWVTVLEDRIIAWACVHRTGFVLCKGMRRPRAIVYSCHDTSIRDYSEKRRRAVFSVQTFKRWKKVDKLVLAVPYLSEHRIETWLAGDGIERRYMTSKEKCRKAYFCTKENDMTAPKSRLGKKIWDNALKVKMLYTGPISEEERDQFMQDAMFFVDLSFRPTAHGWINRTAIEAVRNGCIPMLHPETTKGAADFVQDLDYYGVSPTVPPANLAESIACAFDWDKDKLKHMRKSAQKKIQAFDRKIACQQLIDLAQNKPGGWDYAKATPNKDTVARGRKMFAEIFGEIDASR
jgi:glycosyltransferase involved in cell wall biosynthesis